MSDFKALAKHSTNYLFAIMATKALAFISIPVYTRLLSIIVFGGEMNLWIKIPVFFILTCLFMWGYKSYIFKVLRFYH